MSSSRSPSKHVSPPREAINTSMGSAEENTPVHVPHELVTSGRSPFGGPASATILPYEDGDSSLSFAIANESSFKAATVRPPKYQFMYHGYHAANPSLMTTPRMTPGNTPRQPDAPQAVASPRNPGLMPSPRDYQYEGIPEGLLATEGSTLSASFSMAPSKADTSTASISALHLCGAPTNALLLGDTLGRVEYFEDGRGSMLSLKHTHQAFVAELDCLKSVHIQEKVMSAKFLTPFSSPNSASYLAANERNIKLFRLRADHRGNFGSRRATMPTKAFTGRHQFHVQQLSTCADGETFMSCDDLQVFWWHLEAADSTKAACLVDIKPPKMDDISEVITAAAFHRQHSSMFLVATSSGEVRLGDLRDPPSRKNRKFDKCIELRNLPADDEELSEILSSVSDAQFVGERQIVTRDYLNVRLWDLRKPTKPVSVCPVMNYAKPYLPSLYDSDSIFDRFSLAVDEATGTIATGLYNGCVAVWKTRDSPSMVEHYQGDTASGHGVVKREDLYHEVDGKPIEDIEGIPKTLSDTDLGHQVQQVAISEGAERVAFSVNDHFFVFRHAK